MQRKLKSKFTLGLVIKISVHDAKNEDLFTLKIKSLII